LVSQLYPKEENKPGYGKLRIFDAAEAPAILTENQSKKGYMAVIMQLLD
jgi:hypothetical protein